MTDQPTGPRCGNNPNFKMSDGDRKAVDDFKARLALQAAITPYIERAVWVDFDPLMEVIAATVWEHCARDDEEMPQLVCDDPRTIAAFAAAVARAHAARPTPATDQAAEPLCVCGHPMRLHHEDVCLTECGCNDGLEAEATDLPDRLAAALTARFTERGNPFAEMRRHEQGPDGWPASHPVGPRYVAEVLRELLAAEARATAVLPAPTDRAAALREAAEVAVRAARGCGDSEAGQYAASVAAGIGKELRRMADETPQPDTDDCCGGVPPELFIDDAGREWHAGDCWCTLAPGHGGQHRCQPCTDRVGAPGWTDEQPAVGAQQPKEAERVVRCSRAILRRPHEPHGWQPQPGMDPVDCPGYSFSEEA